MSRLCLLARVTARHRITCWNRRRSGLFCFWNLLSLGAPLLVFARTMHINLLVLILLSRMIYHYQQKGPRTHPFNVAARTGKSDGFVHNPGSPALPRPTPEMFIFDSACQRLLFLLSIDGRGFLQYTLMPGRHSCMGSGSCMWARDGQQWPLGPSWDQPR